MSLHIYWTIAGVVFLALFASEQPPAPWYTRLIGNLFIAAGWPVLVVGRLLQMTSK